MHCFSVLWNLTFRSHFLWHHFPTCFQDLDVLAKELEDLGVKSVENGASKPAPLHHHPSNILDSLDSSDDDDDDDDEEDDSNSGNVAAKPGMGRKRQPNDGTLLASDPPKPL